MMLSGQVHLCHSPRACEEGQTFRYSCPVTSRLSEEMTNIILLIDEGVRLIQ